MTVQLDKPDNAREFWASLFDDFQHVIYHDDKKWAQDYDKWSELYRLNDFPGDVIDLAQLAYYFKYGNIPMLDGSTWTGDSLELVNKQGRLLKRFNRFVKLSKGYEIDSAMLGKIGDKLQYFVSRMQSFTIDFHDVIDWSDGMFGHSGSCWWGCYSESQDVFNDNGGWAIRFYNDIDDERGIGRTWIVPMNSALVCFNSYGPERAAVSKVIKQVFASHDIELHYAKASVENSQNSEIPYINGGTGFILAESGHDWLSGDAYIDLDWETDGSDRYTCDHCNDRVDSDDYFSGPGGDGIYCESCYDDLFSSCQKCGDVYNNDDIHSVSGHHSYSYLCQHCMSNVGAVSCDDCGDYVVDDYHVTQDSNNAYCESCIDRNTEGQCNNCASYFEYSLDDGDTCECGHVYCGTCDAFVSDPGNCEHDDTGTDNNQFIAVESTVTLCHAKTNNNPAEYTIKVYKLDTVPGLFVYDSHTLDQSYDHEYHVIHNASGLAAGTSDDLSKAIAYMQALAPLHDWTQDKNTTLRAISDGLGTQAGQLRREIIGS